ncbi:MAG: peptide chain release factor N(5)-glutamine methyltransferase [Bacteroidetes bacterium]|nr:peptide chain release factor N(5)-glutamine methyltransferase [Bacteroidota bacterium]
MTYREAEQRLASDLQILYSNRESGQLASWVMEKITGLQRVDRLLQKNQALSSDQEEYWVLIRARMLQHEPIQYVLNEAPFMGLLLEVNRHTLIPRPETEELVSWVLDDHPEENLRVLDAGTGSGCIALALKQQQPDWEITAGDSSLEALQVAAKNAARYQLPLHFTQMDMLNPQNPGWGGKYQVIVSNPPYIPAKDEVSIATHVKAFEPTAALFVPDENPLLFYKALVAAAPLHLEKGGWLYVEINEGLGEATLQLFQNAEWQAELRKDLQGNNRMIRANYY